jgi:DNA-directed RNA polymerase subunit beta'
VIENITFREESDEQTGFKEKVIVESRDRTKNPLIKILDNKGELVKNYNLPVGAHIAVSEGDKVSAGRSTGEDSQGRWQIR